MKISVVVPTYNRKEFLSKTVSSLLNQDFPKKDYEIIIVDDGSTDGTKELIGCLKKSNKNIRYFVQNHGGPAKARNMGIKTSKNNIVAFTDDDCWLPKNWLKAISNAYSKHIEVAGVGGYLEAGPHVIKTNIFAKYEKFIAEQLYKTPRTEKIGTYDCPIFGTNNISYKKSVLKEVKGFDESYPFAAGEDADLKFKVCGKGYKLMFIPIKATHLQEYSWKRFYRQSIVRGRGEKIFKKKWGHVLRKLPQQRKLSKSLFITRNLINPRHTSFILLLLIQRVLINYGKIKWQA